MKLFTAIGLMSGTSLDGVDAALLRTDGEDHSERLGWTYVPYTPELRERIRALFNKTPDKDVEKALTEVNAAAVKQLLAEKNLKPSDIDFIGFHGQTISHNPERRETCQMGDGALLAALTGIDVINDFRTPDVKAGGQGAPLVPIYHQAMAAGLGRPVAILNIGGISNVTYIGAKDELIAFDLGPGNALLDDWMLKHAGKPYDENGATAKSGKIDAGIVQAMMAHPFFAKKAPKSLDRNAFPATSVQGLSLEDGAATLSAFTVEAILSGLQQLPQPPKQWIVTGGGRQNDFFMSQMQKRLGVSVKPIEDFGFNGNATEAEAWAYLAVRSVKGLPITFPLTTGAPQPMTAGTLHRAAHKAA